MDNGANIRSHGSVIEAPGSTHSQRSSVAEGLEIHPFWSGGRTKGLENAPPYTDGPGRIVLANDGIKDCLALLLTPDLVADLNRITHDTRMLEKKHGVLERIELKIVDLGCRLDIAKETIRNPRYRDRAEEMQLALEILQLRKQEAEERKSQLNIGLMPVESSLKLSRYQSQGIFEEALLGACLLDPPEPESTTVFHDADDDTSAGGYSDAPSIYEGTEPTTEQQLLREARMDAIESYDTLRTYQARFDNRQADYRQKLADFHRSEGGFEGTRTDFDHQHIRHVQNLTRDLVSAEQGYRAAKAKTRALESPAGFNPNFCYRADGGDRRSDDVSSEPNVDRDRIDAWMLRVLTDHDVESLGNKEPLDLDEWNARPVEIMDSISAIDGEEYVDEINDWKKHCRALREETSNC